MIIPTYTFRADLRTLKYLDMMATTFILHQEQGFLFQGEMLTCLIFCCIPLYQVLGYQRFNVGHVFCGPT